MSRVRVLLGCLWTAYRLPAVSRLILAEEDDMHGQHREKMRELVVPIVFAILWGLFAIWLRSGRSII